MRNSLVSIVLPVYNGEKYLAQSIESILSQTYENIELIIVNDNSTDNSLNIAQEYAQKDKRIRIISNNENLKLPASLNRGFEYANGEYYTWTSDDNYYSLEAIQTMVNYLEKHTSNVMVCCDFYTINELNNSAKLNELEVSPQKMINENCIGACFLYKSQAAGKLGKYDTQKFLVEDYDYWLRMMLEGDIGHIPNALYHYRIHPNSLTTRKEKEVFLKAQQLREEYLPIYKQKWQHIEFNIKKNEAKMLEKIFSIKKEETRRIIYILGLKIKIKRKNKNKKNIDYLKKYNLAKQWIEKYTIDNKGIAVESKQPNTIYPEVTGYYIPTLIQWGDKQRAKNYGDYLVTIQNEDGSFNDPSGKVPYTFDTAQILKGFAALIENGLDKDDKYKNALLKGCDWILSMQREDGSIATPDSTNWGLAFGKSVPEAVHIYGLEPLRKAAKMYGIGKYEDCIKKALDYYLNIEELTDFTTLSHFNAYVIEGLIDIGEIKRAKRAMQLIELHQRFDGSVPAYSNVNFVCSTGLFQYAICWYKLGDLEKADKAFDYACKLQNKSGGWFGSYGKKANYFPKGEIAWAVKYFLDAIYYGQKAKYENIAGIFPDEIASSDERYITIEKELNSPAYKTILDLGSGKGRYTKKLKEKYPDKNFCCVDLSSKVMDYINVNVEKKEGSILNIPYSDETFDFVFLTESLEHSIDVEKGIQEISRVTKKNGKLIIIDKDKKQLGKLQLAEFEQWFDVNHLKNIMEKQGFDCKANEINYFEEKSEKLFVAWLGTKNN